MSFNKVIFMCPTARIADVLLKHRLVDVIFSFVDETQRIIVGYPRYAHTRFALADEPDVTVLPSGNDPEPIGDLHTHLAHVQAQPGETMRSVALRLAVKHGPSFHPDT